MSKTIGFEVTETVGVTFVNYDIPTDMASAREFVASGYYKWVSRPAGCLALVESDYELKEREKFLVEVKPNSFQTV